MKTQRQIFFKTLVKDLDKTKSLESLTFNEEKENSKREKRNVNQNTTPNFKDLKITKIESNKNKIPQRLLMSKNVIPKHPNVSLFVGSISSGKTTLVANLLTKPQFYGPSTEGSKTPKPFFDNVFLFTGSDDDMYDELLDNGVLKRKHIKFDPQPEDIQKVMDIQMATIKKDGYLKAPKVLIILEDIVDNKKLLNSQQFRSLFIKPRQFSFSVFLLSQYINLVPKGLRQQAINLFIFPQNRAGNDIIIDQFCPCMMDKNEFRGVISQCTEIRDGEPCPFMHINRRCKNSERFRRNLNKIINI